MAHVEGSGTLAGTNVIFASPRNVLQCCSSPEKLQLVPPDVASVEDKLKVVFEQLLPFGQGLSPCKALRSSETTAAVVGSRLQEIEVISACVNPRVGKQHASVASAGEGRESDAANR